MWWDQREKANWMKHEDLNTKIFHQNASKRKRKNFIHNIQDHRGITWKDSNHIHSIFNSYFQIIFYSSIHNTNSDVFNVVNNMINTTDYNFLNTDFSAKEVSGAVRNLKSNSAPGPYGISTFFYHRYWDIIGPDILNYVLNILNNNGSLNHINHTFINLIPKVSSPTTSYEFMPISLCNVIMKIVTKTMANMIKQILPNIINEN